MEAEATKAVRKAGNLQNILHQHRLLLDTNPSTAGALYQLTADVLGQQFDQDSAKIIHYIKVKMDWPLSYKCLLLRRVRRDASDNRDKLNNIANFVFDPAAKIKRTPRLRFFLPTIVSVERQYGSGVCSIFHLQYGFFLINFLSLIIWVALITVPYKVVMPTNSVVSVPFTFSSIFTTKGYLSQSVLFQGFYPFGIIDGKYNLSLLYFLTMYIYLIVWFIFITIRFSSTYKQKVFNSILNTKLGLGFMFVFGRCDYTIQTAKEISEHRKIFQRQFLDLIGNDERIVKSHANQFKTIGYKYKLVVTNLFYIVLSIALGCLNWMILSFCDQPTVDCHGSIIYLALINRLVPYLMVFLTQIEQYKYLSYKLDVVGIRCVFLNVCTILSFTIYFFVHTPSCYETAYGQFIYILLLADLFASLILPIAFGLLLDLRSSEDKRDFDGINVHVQLSPPTLLYSQFLTWLGAYFSPLLSIMILLNIIFSFISHRLYLKIRSHRPDSHKRVYIWNAFRLEYDIYLLAYLLLIVSATSFAVFSTQIKPSADCGPFRHLNASYEIIGNYLNDYQTSVLWISLINFLTSPGLIYFLGVTFFVIAYKLKHEGLAEKQLVFIRENNFESKKNLRHKAVQKLHKQQTNIDDKRHLF